MPDSPLSREDAAATPSGESAAPAGPDTSAASKEAAQQAARQAQALAHEVVKAVKTFDAAQLVYVASLAVVVAFTLVFDIASFDVGVDHAVTEGRAEEMREMQAMLNSMSYSAFSSTLWGKLMWVSALAGIVLAVWGHISKSRAGWVPLAQIAAAGLATLLLLLLFFVGFPDLSEYSDVDVDTTLFGYWVPLLAAATATVASVRRIVAA